MSTFNGLVSEFPDIRIDSFRLDPSKRPPLACFLSHVHSDHLTGLEGLRSPFVYCSAATREILLRLERYPCRINYAKGILEARQQTFKHLHKVLKPLPLDTPTCLELRPDSRIQVTLLDANHCPGAVMFLIEGNGKAVLYTGDIRSEPWFVNSIVRNPHVIEYTSGLKTLDKIYLDTSHISDVSFQTKSEGLAELLRKVSQYPDDTIFYLHAWTYGYEDVWIALAKALGTKVHVDDYKMGIYNSLQARLTDGRFSTSVHLCPEAPALVGHMCGNSPHPGCLTLDKDVRIHSCEKGNMCSVARDPSVVHIQPVVAHLDNGTDIVDVGIGGGGDDLDLKAEMSNLSRNDVEYLLKSVSSSDTLSDDARQRATEFLSKISSGNSNKMSLNLDTLLEKPADLEEVMCAIAKKPTSEDSRHVQPEEQAVSSKLPQTIRFPYSRHSSYPEICHLVEVFRPRDVWPCTVDQDRWIRDEVSISSLFGRYCSGKTFAHDILLEQFRPTASDEESQQALRSSQPVESELSFVEETRLQENFAGSKRTFDEYTSQNADRADDHEPRTPTRDDKGAGEEQGGESQQTEASFTSTLSVRHSDVRHEAYHRILNGADHEDWPGISLLSTNDNHSTVEKEL